MPAGVLSPEAEAALLAAAAEADAAEVLALREALAGPLRLLGVSAEVHVVFSQRAVADAGPWHFFVDGVGGWSIGVLYSCPRCMGSPPSLDCRLGPYTYPGNRDYALSTKSPELLRADMGRFIRATHAHATAHDVAEVEGVPRRGVLKRVFGRLLD